MTFLEKEKSRFLITLLFIFSFLIILGVSFYANFYISFSMHTMEYNMEQRLIIASKWLANLVSIEELDQFQTEKDMELPEYQALRRQLLEFSQTNNILYAYYIRNLGDNLQFIIDNDFDEETRVGLDTEPFLITDDIWILSAFEGNVVTSGMGNYSVGWDGLMSAYAPMFDKNGNVTVIAGVDIEDEDIVRARRMVTFLMIVQIISVAVIFASGLTGLIFFRRQAIRVKEANEKLKSLAKTDELTKLDNRRSFLEHLDMVWKQNMRLALPLSILMIDIDFFKKYNDTLGHLQGDKALIAIAQGMKAQIKRETDFIARFGGEEFVCLLPFLEKDKALRFAEKLVKYIENLKIPHPKSELSNYVTISAGLASAIPDVNITQSWLIDEADKALYKAKQSGRNRVVAA